MKVSQEEKEKRYELLKKIHQHDLKEAYPDEDLPSIEDICFPDWKPYGCGTYWRIGVRTRWFLMLEECGGIRYARIYREDGNNLLEEDYERIYVISKDYSIMRVISPEKDELGYKEYYSKLRKPLEYWKDTDCFNDIIAILK